MKTSTLAPMTLLPCLAVDRSAAVPVMWLLPCLPGAVLYYLPVVMVQLLSALVGSQVLQVAPQPHWPLVVYSQHLHLTL